MLTVLFVLKDHIVQQEVLISLHVQLVHIVQQVHHALQDIIVLQMLLSFAQAGIIVLMEARQL